MRFKIEKNLLAIADVKGASPESVSVELCAHFVGAGMIEDDADNWGRSVLSATGPRYVSDIKNTLARFLYGDESRSIPSDVFDAFCRLTIVGDGQCPVCGGELVFDCSEGHELDDGDYWTPNSWVVDCYVYHCANCGEITKTTKEL